MSLSFLADEDFRHAIVRAVLRLDPVPDILTVQQVGLIQTPDDEILTWAAAAGRIVLSHDTHTMRPLAERRIAEGQPMAGLVLVPQSLAIGTAAARLGALIQAGDEALEDLAGQVHFL